MYMKYNAKLMLKKNIMHIINLELIKKINKILYVFSKNKLK